MTYPWVVFKLDQATHKLSLLDTRVFEDWLQAREWIESMISAGKAPRNAVYIPMMGLCLGEEKPSADS